MTPSWETLIGAYARYGRPVQLFEHMQREEEPYYTPGKVGLLGILNPTPVGNPSFMEMTSYVEQEKGRKALEFLDRIRL